MRTQSEQRGTRGGVAWPLGRALMAGAAMAAATWVLPAEGNEEEGAAFYRERVHPILEANCFECHGGEAGHPKGNLRLTSREGLLRGGDLGPAYDEEEPTGSILLDAIHYRRPHLEMPPKGRLGAGEVAVLEDWLGRGAPYAAELEIAGGLDEGQEFQVTEADRNYWAYRPVVRPEVPEVGDPDWAKNPIDAFLYAGLAGEGLKPSGEASRRVLIRRLSYGLTGLPPALEDVERFERDSGEGAVSELVERLLASPQYGEKWARHWLDLVRYAETNGFERDSEKPLIWRYRDYVIRAFNEDKPYDRFILEQLAGDELEEVTADSLIASGYHRLMQWDDEPADRLQARYDLLDDNLRVTTETFLGMSLGCARCHDHVADPLSQADFYRFMAFFHNLSPYERDGGAGRVRYAGEDEKERFERERADKVAELEQKIAAFEAKAMPILRGAGLLGESGEAGEAAQVFLADSRAEGQVWRYTLEDPGEGWAEVGYDATGWVEGEGGFGSRGTPGAVVRTEWKSKDIWMRATFRLAEIPGRLAMELHHDEDVEVFLNGHAILSRRGYLRDYETVVLGEEAVGALQTGMNVVAVRVKQTGGGQYIDLGLSNGAVAVDLAEAIGRLDEGGSGLVDAGELAGYRAALVEREEWGKRQVGMEIFAAAEVGPEIRPMQIHLRGSAHALGAEVRPGFPEVLGGGDIEVPEPYRARGSSGMRRVLAEWIASVDNPLTARVMANRVWQHHFGRGLVPSSSEFGRLGEGVTHPELLDWLAAELMESGWSIKDLHRTILSSRAYQMSSAPVSEGLAADPTNTLLWRFPMRRLTGEELRDSILAVSGQLNLERYGEPIFPPMPSEVLATSSRPSAAWGTSTPEDAARRSIYVKVKRSLQMPILLAHDQAPTDSSCAVRFATTVPTQALGMLNSAFVNEQAAALAERLRQECGESLDGQVRGGLELATGRPATEEEVAELVGLAGRLRREQGVGEGDLLGRIALVLLNLNEFIYLD